MTPSETASALLRAGLCVLPARADEKRPTLSGWKMYQRRLPTEDQVRGWFADRATSCIVAGEVSGFLEMLDFDAGGAAFDAWVDLVRADAPDLLERLVVERSPSGGRHVVYRCPDGISGNLKLAQRRIVVPTADPVELFGKRYTPRKAGDTFEVVVPLIETRGEGGLFLCDPTPGYELLQGDFSGVAAITAADRELLLRAAWSLDEMPATVAADPEPGVPGGRPGDDFNARGDVREVLERHGWVRVRGGENEYWRRPGKDSGWSATLKAGVFYVFSVSAAPFEPNRGYSPFGVFARLEHGGDCSAAAADLRARGFGWPALLRRRPVGGSRSLRPLRGVRRVQVPAPRLVSAGRDRTPVAGPRAGVVVNDLVLREDCGEFWEPFFLATFLHELAHVVERPEPAPVSVPMEPQRLRFEALVLADATARPVAVRVAPVVDPAHGPRFVRAALHLRHRAGRHGVRVGPGLVFDARGRGLSHANAYRAALGDEPVRMAHAAIRDVLAAPLPEPFARLWADDVEAPPLPRTSAEPWPNN